MWFFCHGDGPNFGGEAKPGMAERAGARGGAPAAHAAVRGLAATLRAENTVLRDRGTERAQTRHPGHLQDDSYDHGDHGARRPSRGGHRREQEGAPRVWRDQGLLCGEARRGLQRPHAVGAVHPCSLAWSSASSSHSPITFPSSTIVEVMCEGASTPAHSSVSPCP